MAAGTGLAERRGGGRAGLGGQRKDDAEGASIALGARRFRKPTVFALAAAQAEHWAEALDHLLRGAIVTWAEHIGLSPRLLAGLRQVAQHEGLEDDFRLMLALKLLNPEIPLIQCGEIVTPAGCWSIRWRATG